jgi:micrococcal nuclease
MHKERVRVHGIDTPESRTRDKVEKKFGLYAKKIVQGFLPKGSTQTLVTMKDATGKFGRILGKFEIYDSKTDQQMMMGDWMIRESVAVAYEGQSKKDIEEQHLANRKRLIEAGMVK